MLHCCSLEFLDPSSRRGLQSPRVALSVQCPIKHIDGTWQKHCNKTVHTGLRERKRSGPHPENNNHIEGNKEEGQKFRPFCAIEPSTLLDGLLRRLEGAFAWRFLIQGPTRWDALDKAVHKPVEGCILHGCPGNFPLKGRLLPFDEQIWIGLPAPVAVVIHRIRLDTAPIDMSQTPQLL